jgi:hypothetical protein
MGGWLQLLRDPAALAAHTSRLHSRFTAGDQQRRSKRGERALLPFFYFSFFFSIENSIFHNWTWNPTRQKSYIRREKKIK